MTLKVGKIIAVSSVKGGVGKTTTVLNLAGIYAKMNFKVLIVDFDLSSGGIAASLNINIDKDIFMMIDAMYNNRFTNVNDYVTKYNDNIDVLCAPRDPRQANKVSSKYVNLIWGVTKSQYDVILVDTSHTLNELNLTILDTAYMCLYIITNDVVDLKNMKSLVSIFKDTDKTNYLTVLNNARDTGKSYLSLYDIRNTIKANIDYTISKNFYIKNIDKYVLDGQILTLVKKICLFNSKDINNMKNLALNLIDNKHSEIIKEAVKKDGEKKSN